MNKPTKLKKGFSTVTIGSNSMKIYLASFFVIASLRSLLSWRVDDESWLFDRGRWRVDEALVLAVLVFGLVPRLRSVIC